MEATLRQIAAVREGMGWFDRSTMGKLAITGRDRYSWLQGMVSNDVRLLEKRGVSRLPACILDPTGHIIADITLVDAPDGGREVLQEPFVLLETPPGAAERIGEHLDRYLIMEDAGVVNISTLLLCTSIQGPATNSLNPTLNSYQDRALIVEADHSGSGGVDVYASGDDTKALRGSLQSQGATEIGPTAQEILRIEAGIPKYGVDMDVNTLAPEAGLVPSHISLTKGCYVGQEIVARIDSRGHTNRALTGLLILGETLPMAGEKLYCDDISGDGKETGWVTSVAPIAPGVGGRPIALGYVRHEHRSPGTWLRLGAADSRRMVEVAELPFYPSRKRGT